MPTHFLWRTPTIRPGRSKCSTGWRSSHLPSDMMMGVGDLYSQTGDYDDALKVYLKIIQQDPIAAAGPLLRG